MRKWKKPELKVLEIENTFGIQAGDGYEWICANCYGDSRNDINEIGTTNDGVIYTTPNQNCGDCKTSNKWIKVLKGTRPIVGIS